MSDQIFQTADNSDHNDRVSARPRERIVTTAREMFHQHGVRGVGIEAITEAAGTNKMTLYRHFASKDDLIVECLQRAAKKSYLKWDELEHQHPGDPKAQLRAWIENAAECISGDWRGCEMANTAVELADDDHPAKRVIEEVKKNHRNCLAKLCARAGLDQPELAADMLGLLLEGARISRQSEGQEGPSARFKRMAEEVIATVGGLNDKT